MTEEVYKKAADLKLDIIFYQTQIDRLTYIKHSIAKDKYSTVQKFLFEPDGKFDLPRTCFNLDNEMILKTIDEQISRWKVKLAELEKKFAEI